jgi:hypothetical protein
MDEAKFRAEAKAAGYTDDEINASLGSPAASVAPPSPATESANKATAENEAEYARQGSGIKKKFEEKTKEATTIPIKIGDFETDIPSVFGTPVGVAGTVAALYGGYKATEAAVNTGKKVYDSLRDKMSSGAQTAPTFAQELATDQTAINQTKSTPTGPTPENPTVDLNTKINNKPNNFNLVEESEQNKLKNETANARKQGVNPLAGATELRTGTGKPAFEGANPEGKIKSSYPDIKSVPKGYAFIPDARYIDVLRNDLGQAEYTKNLTGRPFPKEYSGPAGAVEVGKEINRSLGRETRAELLAKGIPESQLPKPTPGILEKTNAKGNKAVTVGGIVGAIAALPNLVHAAQGAGEKDVQKSYGSLVQGVGQFLGPLGAIGSELFGISPEELDTLRKAEKSRKQPVPPPR